MFSFTDLNGLQVDLSFKRGELDIEPKHVLVLLKHENKWLCTIHKRRGVEVPGGKQESGETLEQAAIREVFEETGVHVKKLRWFAEYAVYDDILFCKTVFTAQFAGQEDIDFDLETSGMTWLTDEEFTNHPNLSFHMKDEGMQKMLEELKHYDQW
ncbi:MULTISPECIES: NUDIX domain-containing protein [unclassified Lysinibacillus]|uniref:NUDIX domain-containing protein n=1 Tax=unclassified Lysinibacillus TaxID=2636778 RepID=UPI002012C62D|nr:MULTISPECIES: NUDIX domain-containing protein [unclassified Lysinibacillus]MCL1695343.1 NUDIX domain-containing protein [Lysinibacillus sp. BPa_S21]MCL1700977.1 NUDIX domain-containing protein [Lysinibacillus sp. Bpr_S20]